MLIAALPDAETAGNIATLLFSLTLTFNGVMQPASALPGFWIFMYRVSPLTYLVAGIAGTGMSDKPINCASNEFARFPPPSGMTCGEYLREYLASPAGMAGSLFDPSSATQCMYCPSVSSNQFLGNVNIKYGQRWRDYGIGFAYIGFNIAMAVALYYIVRVKRWDVKYFVMRSGGWIAWGLGQFGTWVRVGLVGHGKELPSENSKDVEKRKGHIVF